MGHSLYDTVVEKVSANISDLIFISIVKFLASYIHYLKSIPMHL